MLQIVLSLFLAFLAVGCGPRCDDCFSYPIDSSCHRPTVVLLPVIERCKIDGQLDLSKEFTTNIEKMLRYWRVYLMKQEEVDIRVMNMGGRVDFSTDITVLANNFREADYLVLIEVCAEGCNDTCTVVNSFPFRELRLQATVKVIDARETNYPRIRVQELHSDAYLVKPNIRGKDGICPAPGTPLYRKSSIGVAQKNLTRDIVVTIEDLIKEVSRY